MSDPVAHAQMNILFLIQTLEIHKYLLLPPYNNFKTAMDSYRKAL